MLMRTRTPWSTKLRPACEPHLVAERRGLMLVPTPLLVAAELRRVPRGHLITPALLRDRPARQAAQCLTPASAWAVRWRGTRGADPVSA